MVKTNIHKTRIFAAITIATLLAAPCMLSLNLASADRTASSNTTFNVNLNETLLVSVTTPDTWASGEIDKTTFTSDLLVNTINVSITSNNGAGYAAGLLSSGTTNLVNTEKSSAVIPTLASDATATNFPTNYWGYSTDGTNYKAMSTSTQQSIISSSSAGTTSKDVYFGAKAGIAKEAGTYANTVIISVVTGTSTISTPTDPVTPSDDTNDNDNTDNGSTYIASPAANSSTGATVKTTTSSTSTTTTTTTRVSAGDTRAQAQGVTTSVGTGSGLATGLAVTAAVAATAGVIFFIVAKRKKDEDEEEDYYE